MVDKDDHETLEKALQIEEGKDQVTLFTCTPYGVNSHRLLVREPEFHITAKRMLPNQLQILW